jgi:hypothetical protein
MRITDASHLDHGLLPEHLWFIEERFGGREGFFAETVTLPEHLADLPCALHGPVMGDAPVGDDEATYQTRPGRGGASRMVKRPVRATRQLTVVAGPHEPDGFILYTAFGGPLAPREPFEFGVVQKAEREESERFWREHALSLVEG